MPSIAPFISRLLQSIAILFVTYSFLRFLHNAIPTGEGVASSHGAKKYTSQHQGVISLPTFQSSRISGHEEQEEQKEPLLLEAKRISPRELMDRSLPADRTRAPKLLHQSWTNDQLPAKFHRWSSTCRKVHPDWEYVLWTDTDNYDLVIRYAPWFLKTYEGLESEIYRADAIRNIYMHVFGGVYADLDTECIKPYDSLFAKYNISTAPYHDLNIPLPYLLRQNNSAMLASQPTSTRKAFLGRMGTNTDSEHSIPNAWMASTPGHPFWLLPLEKIKDHIYDGGTPEGLTGPISLRDQIADYQARYHGGSPSLDEHYTHSPWSSLYPPRELESLEILPFWMVYPYSWQRDGDAYRNYCLIGQVEFDATRCKEVLSVQAWGSWSVTYWSHSWDASGAQHLEALEEEGQGKEEDAGEAMAGKNGKGEEVKDNDDDKDNGEQRGAKNNANHEGENGPEAKNDPKANEDQKPDSEVDVQDSEAEASPPRKEDKSADLTAVTSSSKNNNVNAEAGFPTPHAEDPNHNDARPNLEHIRPLAEEETDDDNNNNDNNYDGHDDNDSSPATAEDDLLNQTSPQTTQPSQIEGQDDNILRQKVQAEKERKQQVKQVKIKEEEEEEKKKGNAWAEELRENLGEVEVLRETG
ncbi:MAG: hypothetical protein Q9163_000004 [Psora crenata]